MNNQNVQIVACTIRIASWARIGEGKAILDLVVHLEDTDLPIIGAPRP